MNYRINLEAVDAWNEEYHDEPEEQYSYEDCERDLEKCLDRVVQGLLEEATAKLLSEGLEPEYFWESEPGSVRDTECIQHGEFESLVYTRIKGIISRGTFHYESQELSENVNEDSEGLLKLNRKLQTN